jgi:hypothetical protein
METKKVWIVRFLLVSLVLIFGLSLVACGEDESAGTTDGEQTAAEQPAIEQPAANPVVGTWQDDSGTYTYTEDGKLLQNGEDSGTYTYQDGKLTENYADGSTRTYTVQFDGNSMTQVAEDDGSSFTLQRADDGALAAEPQAPTTGENPPAAGSADLGFRPEVNGFSFANYGDDQSVTNLTPAEVRRMFGDQVCASLQGDTCILIPPAEQWMEQNNSGMSGGHCEGFAALSLLMYSGKVDPNQFGGATAAALTLDGNELLQREIAYWFVTQATQPAQGAIIKGTPAEIVSALQSAYAAGSNSSETYAVGIYKADGSGGHAVTSYGVEDQGNGIFWILVYDNNYPNDARHIIVDTNANTWEYEASINPDVEPDLYQGNADTQTLEIVPTSARLGQQACDFCSQSNTGLRAPGLAAPAVQYNQVWMEGDAAFLITDSQNRKLGFEGGTFVNQIPEANVTHLKGETLAEQDVPPLYELPVGLEFTLLIDGDSVQGKEDNATDVVMIGPGYYVGVEGIYMDPGQKDSLTLAGDGKAISYKTDYAESPTIIVGIERPAADFELELMGKDILPGSETIVEFDPEEGVLVLRSTADEYGVYYIAITRIDDEGEETFETGEEGIELQPGDIIYFYFGNWDGQGNSLEIAFDDGGDGTIDETVNMADQE